jgi:hypothetical protein
MATASATLFESDGGIKLYPNQPKLRLINSFGFAGKVIADPNR